MKDITELIPLPKLETCFVDILKQKIISRLKEASLTDAKYKLEVKIILYVAILIESSIDKNQKANKRQMLLDIFKEVYGLSNSDEEQIKAHIDLLHLTGKIKKKSYYKLWCTSILEIFRL